MGRIETITSGYSQKDREITVLKNKCDQLADEGEKRRKLIDELRKE
jgi:hypothetical protein